ncbi:SAM-dependent methyltransferase [Neisseria sp. HSC-16F19]|nr:methyltransferase domain-containing protein [Neisseria sp. HSC-16F19]MCP2041343.1 SAM-dependent methyltransferase [Neisseria sp. HSC-16F19]
MNTADRGRAAALAAWTATAYGRYVAAWEAGFFVPPATLASDARVLQLGMPQWPLLRTWPQAAHRICQHHAYPADVLAAADSLPWPDNSFDVVLLPHGADVYADTVRLLAETYRVLVPGGCVLLSGLNALGYWRFGARTLSRTLMLHSAGQMRHALEEAGFQVNGGRFMAYAAPWQRPAAEAVPRAVEHMGNRWWPHWAAVYGLTAVKELAGVHPDADLAAALQKQPELDWAAAVGQ